VSVGCVKVGWVNVGWVKVWGINVGWVKVRWVKVGCSLAGWVNVEWVQDGLINIGWVKVCRFYVCKVKVDWVKFWWVKVNGSEVGESGSAESRLSHRAGIPLGITVRFITPAPGENVGAKRRAIGFGGPPPVPPRPPLLFILPPTRIFLIFWHVVGGKYLRSMEKTRGQKKSMGKSYGRFSDFGPIRRL
jgi:hypothetical protein